MAKDNIVLIGEPDPQPLQGFFVKCLKCGGADIQISNNLKSCESDPLWGSIDMRCRLCGHKVPLYEP